MAEVTKQWYVVRAIGGKEKKVLEYIELETSSDNAKVIDFT